MYVTLKSNKSEPYQVRLCVSKLFVACDQNRGRGGGGGGGGGGGEEAYSDIFIYT